jgi:hypothetical protein
VERLSDFLRADTELFTGGIIASRGSQYYSPTSSSEQHSQMSSRDALESVIYLLRAFDDFFLNQRSKALPRYYQ